MRKNNAKQAFRDLLAGLKVISCSELSLSERFNKTIFAINDFLGMVREQMVSVAFADKLEEIYFFKFEKPEYAALKVYHVFLFTLLKGLPAGPPEVLRAFFLEELGFICRFFKQHNFWYAYFRSGFTELDELLFMRGADVSFALLPEVMDHDPDFGTAGDGLFASFMAYELLQEYILGELKVLDELSAAGVPVLGGKKWFDWSGEMINLVELGYGLYLSKQIGDGKAGLQEIFNWLESSFGVEVGIPANRFREIKRRKRLSRTHYTELMRNALIAYMEEDHDL
jgi:hypothetical protein